MLISAFNGYHSIPGQSGAPTDDGQSMRQTNATSNPTAVASEAPTASFRNAASADRNASAQARRANVVLFVKSNDNDSDAPYRGVSSTLVQQQSPGRLPQAGADSTEVSQAGEKDEPEEGENEDMLSLVVSTAMNGGSSIVNVVTGTARKPLLTVAVILLYFILLDMVILSNNERLNKVLRRIRATDDDAMLLLSSSLIRQMKDAKAELISALEAYNSPTSLHQLEMLQHRALSVERVCNRSITRLRRLMLFPGSAEDLCFLIDEHVRYDIQLQHLAAKEVEWTQTVLAVTLAKVGNDTPRGQKFLLGSAAAAAHAHRAAREPAEETQDEGEEAANVERANAMEHVRLQRVVRIGKPGNGATGAVRSKSMTNAADTCSARAAVDTALHTSADGDEDATDVERAERAIGGLLRLLQNKVVAFALICLLITAVLRMG